MSAFAAGFAYGLGQSAGHALGVLAVILLAGVVWRGVRSR